LRVAFSMACDHLPLQTAGEVITVRISGERT
jgi:hypothetical protein